MKRISLILVILSLFVGSLLAQADMGITAGLNMANVSQKNLSRNGARTGFNAGAFVQYKSGENFIVQPEILYTQKGYNLDLVSDPFSSFSYVQVPILFKYDLGVSDFKIQPFIGPNVAYMLTSKTGNKHGDVDVLDDMERFEYGLDMGVDFVFLKNFMIGARYDMGLSNIIKDAPKKYEVYNRTVMLNLSYILGVSH